MSADASAGSSTVAGPPGSTGPAADPTARRREQRGWYFYDWANSAYVTTVGTVLFSPYLARVAERAACGAPGTPEHPCTVDLHLLGLPVSPGSLPLYVVTVSTLLSAVLLPIVGAFADRTASKRRHLLGYALVGAACAAAMYFVAGIDWQLGVGLLFVANIALAASLVVYDAILVDIAEPDERDRVSSRGWALGYLGGGLLLALNLVLVLGGDKIGVDGETAVRICLLSAGVWWGGFTFIPYLRLRDRPPIHPVAGRGGIGHGFTQLAVTLRDLRRYPQTLLFLVAYLFFNDGVQTVIAAASTYGDRQLGLGQSTLIATILMVQFVAFGGALLFGRLARRFGSRAVIQYSLVVWAAVVIAAYWLPVGGAGWFLALAVLIGIVLGGTQALSRSFYSLLIPRGREAEYFSLYQACERGTSWLGTLVFGVVHQLANSYRPAIVALVAFFVIGFMLLRRVDARRAIAEAGNAAPAVV
jgi:UMF1 family MFS transporter